MNEWRIEEKPPKTGRYLVVKDYRKDKVLKGIYVDTSLYLKDEDRWSTNADVLAWQELPIWEQQ